MGPTICLRRRIYLVAPTLFIQCSFGITWSEYRWHFLSHTPDEPPPLTPQSEILVQKLQLSMRL